MSQIYSYVEQPITYTESVENKLCGLILVHIIICVNIHCTHILAACVLLLQVGGGGEFSYQLS